MNRGEGDLLRMGEGVDDWAVKLQPQAVVPQ